MKWHDPCSAHHLKTLHVPPANSLQPGVNRSKMIFHAVVARALEFVRIKYLKTKCNYTALPPFFLHPGRQQHVLRWRFSANNRLCSSEIRFGKRTRANGYLNQPRVNFTARKARAHFQQEESKKHWPQFIGGIWTVKNVRAGPCVVAKKPVLPKFTSASFHRAKADIVCFLLVILSALASYNKRTLTQDLILHRARVCLFSVIDRNVFEMTEKIKPFRSECFKI